MDAVKMKVPEGCGGCSHGGEWFAAVKGFCTVPAAAVRALVTHGWEAVSGEAQAAGQEVKAVEVAVVDKVKAVEAKIVEEVADVIHDVEDLA